MSDYRDMLDADRGAVRRGGRRWCLPRAHDVAVEGVWAYFECRCGRRYAFRVVRGMMGPLDWAWLSGADKKVGIFNFRPPEKREDALRSVVPPPGGLRP